jgi:hypothetical protein
MSNEMMVGIGIAAAVGLICVIMFSFVRGVHGSLATAAPGEVYSFEYEQPLHGDPKRFLAKVVEPVYTLDDNTIRRLNIHSNYRTNDPQFKRTRHLVTCEMPNGEVRQFYAERTKNVRRTVFFGNVFRKGIAALL